VCHFRKEELVEYDGKVFPLVGGKLRIAHEENNKLLITSEVITFTVLEQAVVKTTLEVDKGVFSAYGSSSCIKDADMVESLLEVAETRAISRALRFAGYGVEFTGMEEISDRDIGTNKKSKILSSASEPQINAIEKIAAIKQWNPLECVNRILKVEVKSLNELSKKDATKVITKMKAVA